MCLCFLHFNGNIHLYLYSPQLPRELLFRMERLCPGPLGKQRAPRGPSSLWSLLLGVVLGAALECGRALTHLTRHPVHILRGGYECFSAMYHFFRTQKSIWMPQVRQGAEHGQAQREHGLPLGTHGWGAVLEKEQKRQTLWKRCKRCQRWPGSELGAARRSRPV